MSYDDRGAFFRLKILTRQIKQLDEVNIRHVTGIFFAFEARSREPEARITYGQDSFSKR